MGPHNQVKAVRSVELRDDEIARIKPLCFMTAKPAMYVGNVSDDGFTDNPLLERLTEFAASRNAAVVAICAAIESEIVDLPDEDGQAFLGDMGMDEPGRTEEHTSDTKSLMRISYAVFC